MPGKRRAKAMPFYEWLRPGMTKSSGRHRGHTRDWLLHDRHIDHGGEHAEQDRQPPHRIVGAGAVEHEAAQPTPRKPPTWWLKKAKPASVASQRVPNIKAMMPLVGGTVESHIKPIVAPKIRQLTGVTGNEMNATIATARMK